jgi:hypothetical protein
MLKPVKQKMPTFVNPFRDEFFPHYASLSRWRGFHTTRCLFPQISIIAYDRFGQDTFTRFTFLRSS